MACDCHPQTDLCDSCTELLATGAEQERERIITMLQQMNHECQCAIRGPERDRVIELIKGENNAE